MVLGTTYTQHDRPDESRRDILPLPETRILQLNMLRFVTGMYQDLYPLVLLALVQDLNCANTHLGDAGHVGSMVAHPYTDAFISVHSYASHLGQEHQGRGLQYQCGPILPSNYHYAFSA